MFPQGKATALGCCNVPMYPHLFLLFPIQNKSLTCLQYKIQKVNWLGSSDFSIHTICSENNIFQDL